MCRWWGVGEWVGAHVVVPPSPSLLVQILAQVGVGSEGFGATPTWANICRAEQPVGTAVNTETR
jgi:hypothetical protein